MFSEVELEIVQLLKNDASWISAQSAHQTIEHLNRHLASFDEPDQAEQPFETPAGNAEFE